MKFTFTDSNLVHKEFLANMVDGEELKQACVEAIQRTTDLETLLQLRVEFIVLLIHLRELPTAPQVYSFLPYLLSDLQSKITAEKLRLKGK